MLEATRHNVFEHTERPAPRGVLVRLGTPDRTCLYLDVDHEAAVFFGRDCRSQPGVVLAGRPNDAALSRRHALLGLDELGAHLTDLDSTNGTWLNGRKLLPIVPVELWPGDEFRVGSTRYAWFGAPALAGRTWQRPVLELAGFEQACQDAWRDAPRRSRSIALLVLKFDDNTPRIMAESLRARLPATCVELAPHTVLVGALGPRELGILLPEAGRAVALEVAAHVLWAVSRQLGDEATRFVHVGRATLACDASGRSCNDSDKADLANAEEIRRLLLAAARADCAWAASRR